MTDRLTEIIPFEGIKGRLDITKADRDALEAGYLMKATMLNRCPKKGEHIAATFDGTFTRCEIFHKELLGSGPPGKAYRVIFGGRSSSIRQEAREILQAAMKSAYAEIREKLIEKVTKS